MASRSQEVIQDYVDMGYSREDALVLARADLEKRKRTGKEAEAYNTVYVNDRSIKYKNRGSAKY